MKYILNAQQMRCADQGTIRDIGIPSMVLMERAALALAEEAVKVLNGSCAGKNASYQILAVCGSGNNGGDGFAAARILREKGYPACVLFVGNPARMSEECTLQSQIYARLGGTTFFLNDPELNLQQERPCFHEELFSQCSLIIDAVFGIGLCREVTGTYAEVIRLINSSGAPVIAADIPSGINSDTGAVEGIAVKADVTVTFEALKYGHLLYPGADHCGKVITAAIGINVKEKDAGCWPESEDISELLPVRPVHSNKGTFGKTLLVSGREGMCGAALLAGEAAYRTGTGIVTICSADGNRIPIQTRLPEAIFLPWSEQDALRETIRSCSAAAIGPGLGREETAWKLVQTVFDSCCSALVADADALNLIAQKGFPGHTSPLIITPHPGEMARLMHCSIKEVMDDPPGKAAAFARENKLICVLKDAVTVITDGERVWLCHTGCSGMATGGSGDVLAGMIAGFAAQGMAPFNAAAAGVWIHGSAGTNAARRAGDHGMLASDIIRELPDTIRQLYVLDERAGMSER